VEVVQVERAAEAPTLVVAGVRGAVKLAMEPSKGSENLLCNKDITTNIICINISNISNITIAFSNNISIFNSRDIHNIISIITTQVLSEYITNSSKILMDTQFTTMVQAALNSHLLIPTNIYINNNTITEDT